MWKDKQVRQRIKRSAKGLATRREAHVWFHGNFCTNKAPHHSGCRLAISDRISKAITLCHQPCKETRPYDVSHRREWLQRSLAFCILYSAGQSRFAVFILRFLVLRLDLRTSQDLLVGPSAALAWSISVLRAVQPVKLVEPWRLSAVFPFPVSTVL